MKYEFHPEAEQELIEAASRYESEVSKLGFRFADEVERVIRLLIDHPESGSRMSFTLSPSLTAVASPAIGGRVSRTASKGFGDPGSRLLAVGSRVHSIWSKWA